MGNEIIIMSAKLYINREKTYQNSLQELGFILILQCERLNRASKPEILATFLLYMNDKGNIINQRPPFLPMLIGTGFGSGFWPWGPGTAGSVLATVVWGILGLWLPAFELSVVTLALVFVFTVLGTWATKRLQPYWGEDPSRVVVDEMVGVWIPLIIVGPQQWGWAFVALVLFRFFDIVKPLGIKKLDCMKGAFWVMGDDILGGIYASFVLVVAMQIVKLMAA